MDQEQPAAGAHCAGRVTGCPPGGPRAHGRPKRGCHHAHLLSRRSPHEDAQDAHSASHCL